jgi:hypothetical protein
MEDVLGFCYFGQVVVTLINFGVFLKLFVKMRLAISRAGIEILYFLDQQIKSSGCLKYLGEVWATNFFIFLKLLRVYVFFIDS